MNGPRSKKTNRLANEKKKEKGTFKYWKLISPKGKVYYPTTTLDDLLDEFGLSYKVLYYSLGKKLLSIKEGVKGILSI